MKPVLTVIDPRAKREASLNVSLHLEYFFNNTCELLHTEILKWEGGWNFQSVHSWVDILKF